MCHAISAFGQIRCKIEHYSTEDGLSHDGVTSITKDNEGFMWFGTWDGINRFDGHRFITYKARPGDSSSLKNNRIENIVADKSGFLWVLDYDKQIYRFDKKKESFFALSGLLTKFHLNNLAFEKIIRTSDGNIWLTSKGNGVFCVNKPHANPPQIIRYGLDTGTGAQSSTGKINFFHEDKDHRIWIGTSNRLYCLKKDNSGIYKDVKAGVDSLRDFNFTGIAEDDKRIWFTTGQGYIVFYDKQSKRFFEKRLTGSGLNAVCVSHKPNIIYLSTSNGELITLNAANLQTSVAAFAGRGPFLSLYEDKSGQIWIEPEKHGVIKYNPANKSFKYYYQENDATFTNPPNCYRVFEDNDNVVWVNMKSGGFGYYNPGTDNVDYFYDQPGSEDRQFSNLVTCRYLDKTGILWLSTNDRGINKITFQRNDFKVNALVGKTNNRSDNEIRGMFYDKQNRLWLASKSGKLYVSQNGTLAHDLFINEPSTGLGIVYAIMQDHAGNIWIATKGNGLFKAESVNNAQYKLSHFLADEKDTHSLSSNLVYSIIEDKKGRIFVGTFEHGINQIVLKDNKIQFENYRNSFKNYPKGTFSKIRNLRDDADGNIWIATTDGLLIMDANHSDPSGYQFKIYVKQPGDKTSLGNNNIQYVFRDSKNRMWLCTSGGGLNMAIGDQPFNSLKFRIFTTRDGLPSDYILSCVQDSSGYIRLATENGLSKFNPSTNQFRNYNSYNGLPKTGFSEASCLKLSNGNMLFGCIGGYVLFDPANIIDHKIKGNIALTNLQINNKDVVPGKSASPLKYNINNTDAIELKYNQNIISVDYTVLDYRSGNNQQYAYRLKGLDSNWQSNQNQHRATYTNLPPGKYTFEVKCVSSDLYLNQPKRKLAIIILPPFWLTWWAYLLYFITLVIVIEIARRVALTMLRLRQRIAVEQKLADLKMSFFTNISHELRTPLTLILNPINAIRQREILSAQGQEYIEVVRKNANRMVRFINQLLDLRKMQNRKETLKVSRVEIFAFVKQIGEYFNQIAAEKQIDFEITSASENVEAWIDAEKIDIVIYNILANAFKFTPDGKTIRINIFQNAAKKRIIKISDQGIGVPSAHLDEIFKLYYEVPEHEGNYLKGTGIGLALSREIVMLHNGNIYAENNIDGGLTVTIELEPGKDHFKNNDVIYIDPLNTTALVNSNPVNTSTTVIKNAVVSNLTEDLPLLLLVEDNNELRRYLSTQLRESYRVEEAENGEVGLEKATQLLPDLILSDIMMPKMDGIKMLDRLKNQIATSHIPVILLTARLSMENQLEGLKYGADYYITKPFENDFLIALIGNLIKQRKKIFESLLTGKRVIALNPGEIVITSKDEVFLKNVIKIVEGGMADPEFHIDTVAESIGMGRTTFYKKLKSLTNLAPVEFIRDMRLKRSKQLLESGEHNVSEIGYMVGFSSPGYFGKCFKEKYDISPTDYIRTLVSEKAPQQ